MRAAIARALPKGLKKTIAKTNLFENYRARDYAKGLKRIDICSAQIAMMLQQAGITSLRDKVCLEVGSGWLLTHAVVMHLLGARTVYATDITPHARPEIIKLAIRSAVDSVTRDHLAQFSSHDDVRRRLSHLRSISRFSFDALEELGIKYLSPVNIAEESIGEEIDFIYSISVMEHVPVDDIPALLDSLYKKLRTDGDMIHWIHMEDHRNFSRPFDFFSIPEADYPRELQTRHGNRVRASEWKAYFNSLSGAKNQSLTEFQRLDKALPDNTDASLSSFSEDDLRTSHILMHTKKPEKAGLADRKPEAKRRTAHLA
ncbi:MAG: methyltransferase domain-containing protein [Granulosicoccus sp.]